MVIVPAKLFCGTVPNKKIKEPKRKEKLIDLNVDLNFFVENNPDVFPERSLNCRLPEVLFE